MITQCIICGNNIVINSFKGMSKTYIPCSFECFIELCKRYGTPISESKDLKIKKNTDIKIYRSELEKEFAEYAKSVGLQVYFEPYIFIKNIKGQTRYYLPDFYLPEYGTFIEIKGSIWGQRAYRKYIEFAKSIPVLLVNSSILKIIKHKLSNTRIFEVKGVAENAT